MARRAPTLALLAALTSLLACSDADRSPEAPLAPTEAAPDAAGAPPAEGPKASGPLDAGAAAPTACDPSVPRATPLEIAVLPEAGTAPFTAMLERARSSIRVMVYQMGYGPILEALEAKARAGVRVRVILDVAQKRVNEKYMDRLVAAGAQVVWSDPAFTFMHAKVLVVDDGEALISTGNYHVSFMTKERNFAVRDADPEDVAALVRLFDADFERRAPDLECTRLLVAPTNARERLLALIASARKEIVVESMQLADRDVRDALAERKASGVSVRVLLASPSWIDANAEAGEFLRGHAIAARYLEAPPLHAKAIVVDGERAYAGSVNLSWTSLTKNREVGVIALEREAVEVVRSTFERDWALGAELTPGPTPTP